MFNNDSKQNWRPGRPNPPRQRTIVALETLHGRGRIDSGKVLRANDNFLKTWATARVNDRQINTRLLLAA